MNIDKNTERDAQVGAPSEAHLEGASVGEALRVRREALGLTHRDLSAVTKIQVAHLRYLEEDRFDEFPAEVFARGFLKNYARELRLDEGAILDAYTAQTGHGAITIPIVEAEAPEASAITQTEGRFAHPSTTGRVAYGVALALFIVGLALSVLVFGGDDSAASAAYQPADYSDAWQPVPAGENDWQSHREN